MKTLKTEAATMWTHYSTIIAFHCLHNDIQSHSNESGIENGDAVVAARAQ